MDHLSRANSSRTSAAVADLFDSRTRIMRRDRAFRAGPALFLYERAFDDILERLSGIRRRFESALLIGTPDPGWPERLERFATRVQPADPGVAFAKVAGGIQADADLIEFPQASFDLCVALGTLDTINDLAGALLRLRSVMRPDSLLIGAIAGGDTLPRLRSAMRAADAVEGEATPRVHPRIEAASLGQILAAAGFRMPVVDVDRVKVSYRSLLDLVRDLRAMGITNVLSKRARTPLTRSALAAAQEQFCRDQASGRTVETFELLHFAAWTSGPQG
jgi:SAM-dependent methyltransferase